MGSESAIRAARGYRQRKAVAGEQVGSIWLPSGAWAWIDQVALKIGGTRSESMAALLLAARQAGLDQALPPVPPRPRLGRTGPR